VLLIINPLNGYFNIPAETTITDEDSGKRLKRSMVRLPYFRMCFSAIKILFSPTKLLMIVVLTEIPMK
jgi:hypothetical protein